MTDGYRTTTAAQNAGASSGGMGGADVAGILEAAQGIQDSWLNFSQSRLSRIASSPCELEAELGSYLTGVVEPVWNRAEASAANLSADLQDAVARSIRNWGRADSRYSQGQSFASYLLRNNVVRADEYVGRAAAIGMAVGGPIGALIGAAGVHGGVQTLLDRRLPASLPPRPENRGLRIGAGAYLYAGPSASDSTHLRDGILTGSRARAAYWTWRRAQLLDVQPTDRPNARDELRALVGQAAQSSDGTFWNPSTAPSRGSRIDQIRRDRAHLYELRAEAAQACTLQRAIDQGQEDRALDVAETVGVVTPVAGAIGKVALVIGAVWAIGKYLGSRR